jgi:hypothetical protein
MKSQMAYLVCFLLWFIPHIISFAAEPPLKGRIQGQVLDESTE